MNFLDKIVNFESFRLEDFNNPSLANFPIHLFAKDLKGNYLNCNELMVRTAGLHKPADVIGLPDSEFCWAKHASTALANDQEVMKTGRSKSEILHFIDHHHNPIVGVGIKSPLRSRLNKIIGIIGFSIIQSKQSDVFSKTSGLTKREHICLTHLIRGRTAKQIANELFISIRTVEKHIFNIKTKLKCANKSALIDKAIELGLISFI